LESIQRLDPGTRIELIGGLVAEVERNPRDGVWLLVRVHSAEARITAAFAGSPHGAVMFREPESSDVFLYVHADDVWDEYPAGGS
jgi:hypothetical protein